MYAVSLLENHQQPQRAEQNITMACVVSGVKGADWCWGQVGLLEHAEEAQAQFYLHAGYQISKVCCEADQGVEQLGCDGKIDTREGGLRVRFAACRRQVIGKLSSEGEQGQAVYE